MRITTLRHQSGTRAARIEGDACVLLEASDVSELLRLPDWRKAAQKSGPSVPLDMEQLAPVVLTPRKILCVGRNFADHLKDSGLAKLKYPSLFAKFPHSLAAARGPIVLPHSSLATQGDWEVELAVVVGAAARNLDPADATSCIAGYTVANEGSVRDWQARSPTVTSGKIWEQMTPIGPWMTTSDEIDVGDLEMICEVDGVLMQRGRTSDMIFSPADVVSYVSCVITLDPGDVILLGTPSGTALGRDPAPWLRPGQVVRTAIAGLGDLVNTCVEGPPPPSRRWV